VLERLENHHIKRLKKMHQMWRQAKGNNIMADAELNELNSMMRAMAIENQQLLLSLCLVNYVLFKVLDPAKA